jgi:hypothetical protein
MRYFRVFKFVFIALAAISFGLAVNGCGNGGGPSPVNFNVNWPARSRDVSVAAPNSALSVTFSLQPNQGGLPLSQTFNRSSTTTAHTESYPIPNVPDGDYILTVTFYAQTNGSGSVVASAMGTLVSVSGGVAGIQQPISLVGTVAHVIVTQGQTVALNSTQQLTFTATDSSGSTLALTPGSVFWAISSGSGLSLTQDGMATGITSGTVMVTATVDGVVSSPQQVVVGSPSGGYTVIDLAPPSASITASEAADMDANGDVVGTIGQNGNPVTFLSIHGGQPQVISGGSALSGANYGTAIRTVSGVTTIAGYYLDNTQNPHAYAWNPNVSTVTLGQPAGLPYSEPTGLSSAGVVVGWSVANAGGNKLATSWTNGTGAVISGSVLYGDAGSYAQHINDIGDIIGVSAGGGNTRAWVLPHGTSTILTVSPLSGDISNSLLDINNSGVAVGYSTRGIGSAVHAILWSGGQVQQIPAAGQSLPQGFVSITATSINSSGTVVGTMSTAANGASNGTVKPFIWDSVNGLRDLSMMVDNTGTGWQFTQVCRINDTGWIAGTGISPSGQVHAFILEPIGRAVIPHKAIAAQPAARGIAARGR